MGDIWEGSGRARNKIDCRMLGCTHRNACNLAMSRIGTPDATDDLTEERLVRRVFFDFESYYE